jgi:hypothetical protein
MDRLLSHRHNGTPLVVLDTMATEDQASETDHLDQTLSTQYSNDESDNIGTVQTCSLPYIQ